jgi:RNA polymerase sigma-70 factor (ECF subfamily)
MHAEVNKRPASIVAEGPAGGPADSAVIGASMQDPEQFAVIYDRYSPALHRYAGRRVGAEDADDVVAATFLAAFRARTRYDLDRPDARPWLFGILTKEIARRRRTEQARLRALARTCADRPAAGHADQVAADVSAQATRRALVRALRGLAPADRDVLLLTAWGELSYAEIAEALGVPVGTVRSRLNRARRKVRQALGGTDPTAITEEPS